MIKWIKPNDIEIETNDLKATVEYCESLGWVRESDDLTVDDINAMSGVDMKKLITKYKLGVDKTLTVVDMREAVIAAMSEPEE